MTPKHILRTKNRKGSINLLPQNPFCGVNVLELHEEVEMWTLLLDSEALVV
jgi:hypothetical protein